MQLETQSFEIREILGTTLKSLGVRAFRKGIELIWQCQEDVPAWIVGDPTRLRQILFNLVGNAIKFTSHGEVLLNVRKLSDTGDSTELEFIVIDTGIGIAETNHAKIFDAFQHTDSSTTRRYGGTGLGLAISRRLVQLMEGEIQVESELGKGSTFRFHAKFGKDSNRSQSSEIDVAPLQSTSILVVDDNATNRRILVEMLSAWGLAVHAVESGKNALEYLQVRRDPRLTDVKIIVLGSSVGVAQSEFGGLSIAAFLYKPIKQSELFNTLASTVGAFASSPQVSNSLLIPPSGELESIRTLNVLPAEDGLANQKFAIGLLKRWGHSVTVVGNGADAVNAWAAGNFDVILMDVQMPVMDGLEATQAIRSQEAASTRHVPIVAVTSHAMAGDREKCLSAGMDAYVTKPFKKQALYDAMRPLVQK